MDSRNRNEYQPECVSPPGDTLREILQERGLSQTDLARRMGRPEKTISEIIHGKAAVTAVTAIQFGLVLGVPAAFWTTREQQYRASLANATQQQRFAEQAEWAGRFPLRQMVARGYLAAVGDRAHLARTMLEFFGVASPQQWEALYSAPQVAFRKSAALPTDVYALAAWLRQGEVLAQRVRCEPFSRQRFMGCLTTCRGLTREPPERFRDELTEACASAGVAVVFVPELPRSTASGAARWLAHDRALIQLSRCYRTDDQLWFTFFHEAAHILTQNRERVYLEGGGAPAPEDGAADQWAQDFLIPPADRAAAAAVRPLTEQVVLQLAERIGVSPGVLVGRLQHDGALPSRHALSRLKRRLAWG